MASARCSRLLARLRLGWWWRWVALAWALVAVVGAVMAASVWVFESETPPDRCWHLPQSRLGGATTGDFLGFSIDLPPGAEDRIAEYDEGTYRLIYQYPDRLETYIREVMEGEAETEDDFVGWAWTRLVDSLQLTTVPKAVVFFVHGHAGSGRQIKELSVVLQTLRPTLTDDPIHHSQLAVFGVHFRGELSALQGDVLRRQAMYVNDCIYYLIHSLYPVAQPPKIVVIGHSMGGVVARAALMMPNRLPHAITALITLGAPLQMSLWPFDPSLSTFYHELNTFRPAPNESVPTFSIAGGLRDHLIRTELSAFYGIEPPREGEQSAFAFTTAIPGVSTSIDHDSLLTCGQFLTVLGRCILHIVNPEPVHNYSSPREQALAAFRHHFLSPVPRLLGLKPGVLDSIVDVPRRVRNSTHNATKQPEQQTETIDDPRYYLYEPTLKNTTQTQVHRLSLSTWRKRYGQMQLVVATDLPPHALTVSLTSKNGTNSSIPSNWWIEAPMGYAPRAFVGVNSTQAAEAPRLLIVPAETLNQHDVLLLTVSPRTPDPLDVSNNVTVQPATKSSFLFAQLYNEYATQIPVFDDDGGQFTVEPTGPLLVGGSVGGLTPEDQIRSAVTHFTLPGNTKPVSVWVNPSTSSSSSSSSTTKVGRPMWEPIVYQYSTCSSLLFEEENVYVDTLPAVIRSHYRTIPQLYRECSSEESTVHLFLFTDPQYEYQVVIEPHKWVTVGHMFSTFVTLSLPAAFLVFALVFAVQRWTFARTGSLHSFAWTLLRLVPVLLAAALCASAALYVFDPPVFMLHESALVFATLSPFTPSFSFHHDPVTNQRMPAFMPVVVFTYGTLLVLAFAMLQVCLLPCVDLAWRRAAQARGAIGRRAVCQRAAVQRVSGCLAHPYSALLIKVAVCLLSILVWRTQPFFTAIVVAFALTLMWVEDEALRYFRQSLSVLLALFLTYHFGCLWFSWAASHPFDGASAFTLPTIALALCSLYLTEMPHTPALHYFLAVTGAGVAGYLFLFSWHAVHMIVYAVIALSVCALLGLVASLLPHWIGLAAQLTNGSVGDDTTALHEVGDDSDSNSDGDGDNSDGSVPLSVWYRLRRTLRRLHRKWRRHYSRTEASSLRRPVEEDGGDNL